MGIGIIVAILFLVVAVISGTGVYVAIKDKNNKFRNIAGVVSLASLVVSILIYLLSGATKSIEVNGINEEYTTDQYGNVTLKADLLGVDDYSKVSIEIFEGKKSVTDKKVVTATLIPSKDKLSIRYTYTRNDSKKQMLTLKVNANNQSVINNVVVKPSTDYVIPEIQKKILAEERDRIKQENIDAEKKDENKADESTLVYGNKSYLKLEINEFDRVKLNTIKRINDDLKTQLEKKDLVQTIDLTKNNIVKVVVTDELKMDSKENKEVANEIIGRRVLGLQRGTLSLREGTPDIPIEVYTESNKFFAKTLNEEKVDILGTID